MAATAAVRLRVETVAKGAQDTPSTRVVVLLAEADPVCRAGLIGLLGGAGHEVLPVGDGQEALDILHTRHVDLVLLDLELPKVSGLNVLSALPSLQTDAKVIVLTAHGTVESAVEAMKLGAYDYVRRPIDPEALGHVVDRALAELSVRRELRRLRGATADRRMSAMVGKTPVMHRLFRMIERVAPTRATVLISGETGTGKELVARAVHDLSPRADKPFVAVNCSAIPSSLLEAELFGHIRGSFTGAVQSRKGLIEEAAGGTLFLDEISTLSADVQVKLLRVLEDRRVQRVGSNASVAVDFRLIAATNKDLGAQVAAGEFRGDLFFRLDVFPIAVPPLRDRRDDIPLLAAHFMSRFAEEHGIEAPRISPFTLSRMMAYDWPGNVRELENFIERSVIMYPGGDGFPFDLPRTVPESGGGAWLGRAVEEDWTLERLEREYLLSTLERTHWQQGTTAALLGINRRTIHRKLKLYREQGFLPGAADA
ncbi:MAG: sigma-54 dependent transcriptional regulator [Longimicrobiales bacterium]